MADLKRLHQEDQDMWQNKLTMMENNLESTSDLERLRACQREKSELEIRLTSMLSELDELRSLN